MGNPNVAEAGKGTQFSSTNQPPIPGGVNKKGSKHISTHIQEMLNDPNFELKLENGEIVKGRPLDAIIKAAIVKARAGDMRAFDNLAKYGWGTKVIHDFEQGLFTNSKLIIEVVKDKTIPDKPIEETEEK